MRLNTHRSTPFAAQIVLSNDTGQHSHGAAAARIAILGPCICRQGVPAARAREQAQTTQQALHGPRPGSGTSGAPCCDAEESVEHGMDGDNGKNFCGGRLRLGLDAKPTVQIRTGLT